MLGDLREHVKTCAIKISSVKVGQTGIRTPEVCGIYSGAMCANKQKDVQ